MHLDEVDSIVIGILILRISNFFMYESFEFIISRFSGVA
jgi:hypothetical protein